MQTLAPSPQTHGFRGWEIMVKEVKLTKRVCKCVLDVVRHDPRIDKREIESPVQLTIIFEPKHGCQIRYDALGFEFNLG